MDVSSKRRSHLSHTRPDAAKFLAQVKGELETNEELQEKARLLARLSHRHIVAVYDFGEVTVSAASAGGAPSTLCVFLMEYVDGATLRQLMRAGELSPEQAVRIVPQICEALQFAHDAGIRSRRSRTWVRSIDLSVGVGMFGRAGAERAGRGGEVHSQNHGTRASGLQGEARTVARRSGSR